MNREVTLVSKIVQGNIPSTFLGSNGTNVVIPVDYSSCVNLRGKKKLLKINIFLEFPSGMLDATASALED